MSSPAYLALAIVFALGSVVAAAYGVDQLRRRRSSLDLALSPRTEPGYGVRADYVDRPVLRSIGKDLGFPSFPDTTETEQRADSKGELSAKAGIFGGLLSHVRSQSTRETVDETGNADHQLAAIVGALTSKGALGAHVIRSNDVVTADQDRALDVLESQGLSDATLAGLRDELRRVEEAARVEADVTALEQAATKRSDVLVEGRWQVSADAGRYCLDLRASEDVAESSALRVWLSLPADQGPDALTQWGASRLRIASNDILRAAVLGSVVSCGREPDGALDLTLNPIAVYDRVDRSEASASSARLFAARAASRVGTAAAIASLLFSALGGVLTVAFAAVGIQKAAEGCPMSSVGPLRYEIENPTFYERASANAGFDTRTGTCRLAFAGYCYGEPYTDADGVSDSRWLVRGDGDLVAHSPGHADVVRKMEPVLCRGGVEPVTRIVAQGVLDEDERTARFQVSRNTAAYVGVVRRLDTGRWQRVGRIGGDSGSNTSGPETFTLGEPATPDTRLRAVACDGNLVPSEAAYSFTVTRSSESLFSSSDALLEPPTDTAEQAACAT